MVMIFFFYKYGVIGFVCSQTSRAEALQQQKLNTAQRGYNALTRVKFFFFLVALLAFAYTVSGFGIGVFSQSYPPQTQHFLPFVRLGTIWENATNSTSSRLADLFLMNYT